jgi:hypothetical protein
MTAGRSHAVTAEALLTAFNAVSEQGGDALDQKILMGKLAAEFVSSLEDLGALLCAIRKRRDIGCFHPYLTYDTNQPRSMYELIQAGTSVPDLLQIPDSVQVERYVSEDDRVHYAACLRGLEERLRNYLR